MNAESEQDEPHMQSHAVSTAELLYGLAALLHVPALHVPFAD
jgi:hypothetical protein